MQIREFKVFAALMMALFVGCTHTPSSDDVVEVESTGQRISLKDLRLAEVVLDPQTGRHAQGTLSFEQMPNSMIVTFRVEGLEPKSTYSLSLHENQDCASLDPAAAGDFSRLRTDKMGVAEGSFRSEKTLTGKGGVVGDSVVIRSIPKNPKTQAPAEIACGKIKPRASNMTL